MNPCPDCNGTGERRGIACSTHGCGPLAWSCSICDGDGKLSAEQLARYEAGRRLREERIARRMTLRAEALRLGISPVELSYRETGRVYIVPTE